MIANLPKPTIVPFKSFSMTSESKSVESIISSSRDTSVSQSKEFQYIVRKVRYTIREVQKYISTMFTHKKTDAWDTVRRVYDYISIRPERCLASSHPCPVRKAQKYFSSRFFPPSHSNPTDQYL